MALAIPYRPPSPPLDAISYLHTRLQRCMSHTKCNVACSQCCQRLGTVTTALRKSKIHHHDVTLQVCCKCAANVICFFQTQILSTKADLKADLQL
jgi:hypothetical protein